VDLRGKEVDTEEEVMTDSVTLTTRAQQIEAGVLEGEEEEGVRVSSIEMKGGVVVVVTCVGGTLIVARTTHAGLEITMVTMIILHRILVPEGFGTLIF